MSDFERIWNSTPFSQPPEPDLTAPCQPAVMFQAWIDALLSKHLEGADVTRINQLRIQVMDRWYRARSLLPREHRDEDGHAPDHVCVFTVFERTIDELYERELALAPPPLIQVVRVEPPEPPRHTTVKGILFGDEESDVTP